MSLLKPCHSLTAGPSHLSLSARPRDDIGVIRKVFVSAVSCREREARSLSLSLLSLLSHTLGNNRSGPGQSTQHRALEMSFSCGFPQLISTLYFSFVNILLPYDAKTIGTRFRWWQPKHDGLDQNDWAIDNVLISGSADQRTVMLDTFSSAPLPQHERSPADAGPTGMIAFDMFVEDKTTGKGFTWI